MVNCLASCITIFTMVSFPIHSHMRSTKRVVHGIQRMPTFLSFKRVAMLDLPRHYQSLLASHFPPSPPQCNYRQQDYIYIFTLKNRFYFLQLRTQVHDTSVFPICPSICHYKAPTFLPRILMLL